MDRKNISSGSPMEGPIGFSRASRIGNVIAAACQAAPKVSIEERFQQIFEALEKADDELIDFLCFPEGFLTGYYVEKELAEQNSLEVNSPDFQNFLIQTASFHVTFIMGFNEREGDKIFDSAAVIEKGELLGVQRKHYLYHDYFTSSNEFSVFQSKGFIFGVVICLDANYFEPSRLLALQGATILFMPMCNKVPLDHLLIERPAYYSHIVARAHENRCWMVGADWVWPNDGTIFCPGHSVIYDPDGREVARSRNSEQHLIVVDIPKERLFQEKGRRVHGSAVLLNEITKLNEGIVAWK